VLNTLGFLLTGVAILVCQPESEISNILKNEMNPHFDRYSLIHIAVPFIPENGTCEQLIKIMFSLSQVPTNSLPSPYQVRTNSHPEIFAYCTYCRSFNAKDRRLKTDWLMVLLLKLLSVVSYDLLTLL
jgi:hypothetical protein